MCPSPIPRFCLSLVPKFFSSLIPIPPPNFLLRVHDAKDSYGVETGNETVQEAVLYPGGCIGLRYGQCFSVQNRRGGLTIFTVKRMLMDTMRCGHVWTLTVIQIQVDRP